MQWPKIQPNSHSGSTISGKEMEMQWPKIGQGKIGQNSKKRGSYHILYLCTPLNSLIDVLLTTYLFNSVGLM